MLVGSGVAELPAGDLLELLAANLHEATWRVSEANMAAGARPANDFFAREAGMGEQAASAGGRLTSRGTPGRITAPEVPRMSPERLLAAMARAYARCVTYRDSGHAATRFLRPDGTLSHTSLLPKA
jgi:hypothetical protein